MLLWRSCIYGGTCEQYRNVAVINETTRCHIQLHSSKFKYSVPRPPQLLNALVTWLLKGIGGHHSHDYPVEKTKNGLNKRTVTVSREDEDGEPSSSRNVPDVSDVGAACPCCSSDPVGDLERIQQMAQEMDTFQQKEHHDWDPATANEHVHEQHAHDPETTSCCEQGICAKSNCVTTGENTVLASTEAAEAGQIQDGSEEGMCEDDEENDETGQVHGHHVHDEALLKMSINTALAIGKCTSVQAQSLYIIYRLLLTPPCDTG